MPSSRSFESLCAALTAEEAGVQTDDSNPDAPLRGDMSRRVVVDTDSLQWTSSPSRSVSRKRLHRVGPAESGQVTSLVRYDAGSAFPVHDHPDGEEILVLEGVFSDEHGDWPAGTWLLNPEGFRHSPFSKEGCLLFVKLRQAPGRARHHVELRTDSLDWADSGINGVEHKKLAAQSPFPDSTWLERWSPGAVPGEREHAGGAEYLVLEGVFCDEAGEHVKGSWLRYPVGARHRPMTRDGCVLYAKYDAIANLRSAISVD
jgi:anti-sigma factor ChrR (cupin superfamily)